MSHLNHPRQNLPYKRPPDKTPGQKPWRTIIEREFVQGAFVWVFCVLGLLKIGAGGQRCVTYFWGGVPECVTKCDRGGRGSKLAKNSVTYFMVGPLFMSKHSSKHRFFAGSGAGGKY